MTLKSKGFWSVSVAAVGLFVGLSAQTPATPPAAQANQTPTFRGQANLATMDVTVRNSRGVFVDDLKRDEFEIYEDGVLQTIVSMTMSHGGRVVNMFAPPPPPPREGVILPAVRRTSDASGRIFIFFIDDLNIQFKHTPQIRTIFRKISKTLLHEGDLLGIVSSGPSSISIDLTYDIKRLERAIESMTGAGLKQTDMITQSMAGYEGPTELRYRAHVAFKTMFQALRNLEEVKDRRKSIVWVSEGYDYKPFQAQRYGLLGANSAFAQPIGMLIDMAGANGQLSSDNTTPVEKVEPSDLTKQMMQDETFLDADLFRDIADITLTAARSNVIIHTVDPRGLMAGPDIDENLDPTLYAEWQRKSQDTIRMLAEETGGVAIVNTNDYDRGLKLIDNASGDYYVIGYNPTNLDPTKRRRNVEIKTTRKGLDLIYRSEYLFKIAPAARRP